MKNISIKGVLIGGIVDIATSFLLAFPFALYALLRIDLSHIPKDQISVATATVIRQNILLSGGQLIVGLSCSLLGGYIAAQISKHNELLNAALSSFLCIILGIFAMITKKTISPLWIQLLLLIASPVFALFGGYFRLWQKTPNTQI